MSHRNAADIMYDIRVPDIISYDNNMKFGEYWVVFPWKKTLIMTVNMIGALTKTESPNPTVKVKKQPTSMKPSDDAPTPKLQRNVAKPKSEYTVLESSIEAFTK